MAVPKPSLFGQKHSSRDYLKPANWGKNIFNSSFPASLVAYMSSQNINPVYLCIDENADLIHKFISGEDLYAINPLSDDAYYNFEAGFSSFEKFYTGDREKIDLVIDLVMVNRQTNESLIGLEIKLTALPDNTTKRESEDKFGCEIVIRPSTICFLACSICEQFSTDDGKNDLRKILNCVPKINHWEEVTDVIPHYAKIENAIKQVAIKIHEKQTPLVVQPVWKMKNGRLADDCLDVFVWSNLALLQLCYSGDNSDLIEINRFQRSLVWIYLMLKDFVDYDRFDYVRIVKDHSYGNANDKAFAISGKSSWRFMHCDQLIHPRVQKSEIKNIILGGGQNLLSPERRFDAVIVNSPDLFEQK